MDTHKFKGSLNPRITCCERCGRGCVHPIHSYKPAPVEPPKLSPAEAMRGIGDTLQSEASRLVEWALNINLREDGMPYEVHQAALGVESAIERWTEFRRTERGNYA